MADVTLKTYRLADGKFGEKSVSADIFGREPHVHLMHLALLRQLANGRAGTAATKTRSEVSGGGKKPWKQKGTGRARAGSIRSPLWRGGGVTFGPQPRSYEFDMTKKARRIAFASALSAKAADSIVFEGDQYPSKTKEAKDLLSKAGLEGKVLIVAADHDGALRLSSRNLANVALAEPENVGIHQLLNADKVVYTQDALAAIERRFTQDA